MPASPPPDRSFIDFAAHQPGQSRPARQSLARARHFWVEWIEFAGGTESVVRGSAAESLVIVAAGPLHLLESAPASTAAPVTTVPADSVAIVPAGTWCLQGGPGTRCALIAAHRDDRGTRQALNAQAYDDVTGDQPTPPPSYRRLRPLTAPQVLAFSAIKASPEKPRLKMLQTETLSINIVDYLGPRDRAALSPHSHADFEQGSLAIHGDFVHHLRTPWGGDANLWREDEHLPAPSPSLVVVPTHVVHTTEGTGEGRHLLIDIFSPPRHDFIASRWVFNSDDYRAVAADAR